MPILNKSILLILIVIFLIPNISHPLSPISILQLSDDQNKRLTPKYESLEEFFNAINNNFTQWQSKHPELKVVFIVRHGESMSNLFQYVQSYEDFSPLTAQGVAQRKAMPEYLLDRGIDFDRYFSSDLERAIQTLEKLAKGNKKPIHILRRLREMIIWPFGGISMEMARKIHPDILNVFSRNPEEFQIANFSGEKVYRYLKDMIDNIIIDSKDQSFIIASHGMTILIKELQSRTTKRSKVKKESVRYYLTIFWRILTGWVPSHKRNTISDYTPKWRNIFRTSKSRANKLNNELIFNNLNQSA